MYIYIYIHTRLDLKYGKRPTAVPGHLGPKPSKKTCTSWVQSARCVEPVCLSANAKAQTHTLGIHSSQMQHAQHVSSQAGSSDGLASASKSLPSSANMLVQRMGTKHGTTGWSVQGSRNKRKLATTSTGPARKKGKFKHQADQLALESVKRLRQARLDPL